MWTPTYRRLAEDDGLDPSLSAPDAVPRKPGNPASVDCARPQHGDAFHRGRVLHGIPHLSAAHIVYQGGKFEVIFNSTLI